MDNWMTEFPVHFVSAAGVVFKEDKVLLIRSDRRGWEFPGGVVEHGETVALLSKLSEAKLHIEVKVDMDELDLTSAESKATYEEIQDWVQEKYGFHVTHLNIAKMKRKCGIIERQNYNLPKSENSRSPETPKEKEEAIIDAFLHFKMM